MELVFPRLLQPGDTIGVFTPSSPGYLYNSELFENGLRNLERMGFKIKLGSITAAKSAQGYRSASGKDRAAEFMNLILDDGVHALVSTIGGYNSSSMLSFLDFEAIRASKKVICGYSDVTSLHLAILKKSALQTFYAPAIMTWHGEWPLGVRESTEWFLDAVMAGKKSCRRIEPPAKWSNHRRDWSNGDWKNKEREWKNNSGWRALSNGKANAPIVPANLNTMVCLAGTPYWPNLKGRILLLEEENAPFMREERSLQQLKLMGVFDEIAGLIVSKPEVHDPSEAPFSYFDLIQEIVGPRNYPIISNFDCGHTLPMITIPFEAQVEIIASSDGNVSFTFL
jgi:muramoyltetrapeptide carboxypeptidase LdcA involved in peptidoglycan recycling